MPTKLLPPGQNVYASYPGSRRGQAQIRVEASGPITIYVTSPAGVRSYRDGDGVVPTYESGMDVQLFDQTVQVPRNAPWCLLLINYDEDEDDWENARAVSYEVYQK